MDGVIRHCILVPTAKVDNAPPKPKTKQYAGDGIMLIVVHFSVRLIRRDIPANRENRLKSLQAVLVLN